VPWEFAGAQPGSYTASIEVDDQRGCITFTSVTVNVVK
jgi:hypothetical protein